MVNFLHGEELVPGYEPGMNQSKAGGRLKAKTLNSLSGLSAFLSTIGSSWSVCHSICLALITVLAGIGIVLTGMPLLFLFEYNLYLWSVAVFLLAPSAILFARNPGGLSKNLMLFNFGVIIAGIPTNLINLQPLSWIIGGTLVLAALIMFIKPKLTKKMEG